MERLGKGLPTRRKMPKSTHMRWLLLTCFVCLTATSAEAATATQTARRCGANQTQSAVKVLASLDGKTWRTYRNIKSLPEIEPNVGTLALVWEGTGGNVLVQIQDPSEDFDVHTDYCFDREGHLVQLRFELSTGRGWGFRQEGPIVDGKLKPQVSEFFNTTTGRAMKKPEEAEVISVETLTPEMYLKKSDLPFSKLLSK